MVHCKHGSGRNVGHPLASRPRATIDVAGTLAARKVVEMSLQLVLLAVVAMAALAVMRVIRVRLGRSPHPDGLARILFFVAFVILPPTLLSAFIGPVSNASALRGIGWLLPYVILIAGVSILMHFAAPLVGRFAPRSVRPTLVLALSASEADAYDVAYDPPVTPALATSIAGVDRANAVFPRGVEFPRQIERKGFRYAWDELDAATTTLEGRIADDRRLGLPVAAAARTVAADARGRLDALRQLAVDRGQIWAT